MRFLMQKSWFPYFVGIGIGVLSWFAFATANKPIGITTAFEYTAALTEKAATPGRRALPASQGKGREDAQDRLGVDAGRRRIRWRLAQCALSDDRTERSVPPLWEWRFGPSVPKRLAAAFFGGALMMFGARLAQGCTSGHGISGALQLALSSWIFVILLFVAGTL